MRFSSSSRASCTRSRGEREVVVSGEEGRAALALALRVADAVRHVAARRLRVRMIARPTPRIFVSAGEPSGDLHGAGVVQALRARYPDAMIEALGGPRMAAAGAVIRYPMEGLAAFGLVEVVTKLARALAAPARPARGLPRRPLRPRHPHRLSRISRPRRRGGAAGGDQGPLLHCAPALGLAAGPRPPLRVGGRPARGGAAVRAAVLRRDSASGATTSAIRWWTAARGPRARRRAPDSAFRRRAGCWASFPGAGIRRSAGCGSRSAMRRSGCSSERPLRPGRGRRNGHRRVPRSRPARDRCAATRSRSSPRRTRRSPSRGPRRSRPRWPTCRWWSPTRCIR